MTTTAEPISTDCKMQSVLRLIALPLMFLFGLFGGMVLSGVDILVLSFVLGSLTLLASVSTVMDLTRSLPAQNIIAIVALIVLCSSSLELINASTESPGEQNVWGDCFGPPFYGIFRWLPVLLLTINLLNSRNAARWIMRPWPNIKYAGLVFLSLTAVLTGISNLGIEDFGGLSLWLSFMIYTVVATITLAVIMPWLIRKKPGPAPAPQFAPLLIWSMLLGILFSKFIP